MQGISEYFVVLDINAITTFRCHLLSIDDQIKRKRKYENIILDTSLIIIILDETKRRDSFLRMLYTIQMFV